MPSSYLIPMRALRSTTNMTGIMLVLSDMLVVCVCAWAVQPPIRVLLFANKILVGSTSGWSWHQPLILYSNPMRSNRLVGQEQRASEEEERFHEEDFGAQILELVWMEGWRNPRTLGGQEPWFSESCLFDLSSDENMELLDCSLRLGPNSVIPPPRRKNRFSDW